MARRPLSELWLRSGQSLVFDRWTVILLILFTIGPVLAIIDGIRTGNHPVWIYGILALVGSVGAAACFRVLGKSYFYQLGFLLVFMIVIGLIRLMLTIHGTVANPPSIGHRAWVMTNSLLFYVPAFLSLKRFSSGVHSTLICTGVSKVQAGLLQLLYRFFGDPGICLS